ncbi:MarR family transcriptional regulator [Paenibacillus sp. SYP-B4298]|uniref:LexA family protein n=1 Tax=Paenibacillus sp. SYP-B4298 TaxID=2996034 RepID=UPI0022DE3BA6|nr:MarR family transcriptional regulator [Paenibacillus sp. SYP-B4298]
MLTPKQAQVLSFIIAHVSQHNYPPTLREIGSELGIKSTSVIHGHLTKLQAAGYISWEPAAPRTLRVLKHAE